MKGKEEHISQHDPLDQSELAAENCTNGNRTEKDNGHDFKIIFLEHVLLPPQMPICQFY
jgi:hypothetical protein